MSVGQTGLEDPKPKGVAINKRALYQVIVEVPPELKPKIQPPSTFLGGIDEEKLLVVNGTRMAFSSGTLSIKLTEQQLTSEVGITSETGAVRAVQAADTALDTANKMK